MVTRRVVRSPAPVSRSTIVTRVTPGAGLSGRPSLCQINPTTLPLSETACDGSRPPSPERLRDRWSVPAGPVDGHRDGERLQKGRRLLDDLGGLVQDGLG